MSYFEAAFQLVVGEEGGYVNDPHDPGGETRYGISKRAYPNLDIANLTLQQAHDIYRRDYWDRLNLDALSWDKALLEFDAAVNQGPGYANTLQGDAVQIATERALRYAENANFRIYGKGWFHRLFTLFKASQVTPK